MKRIKFYVCPDCGNILTATGDLAEENPLRYRGYCYDEETGFYYVFSRYYDPEIRRFVNADVFVSTGQSFLGYNMFAYCRNNPICRRDISGTADVEIFDDDPDLLDDDKVFAGGKTGGKSGLLGKGFAGGHKSGSNTHVPSANTQVVRHPEIKSPNQVKISDVTNYWDDYLGSNQTNIHPRTGLVDNDRIFSADGTRSIRFGNHEMDSMGTTKFHFHLEEWKYDPVNDVMEYFNTLVRIKK